ncbi:MAG: hypothetical protein ABS80_02985 [Pseudonocardia sp. SCN 72-51]|nr:MAG: hypothetical protein ABS80_02985 [Pseudonocardia sp. SCN 72-51]
MFPFGQCATRRDPRRPDGPAELLVLGVYPSALHVQLRLPGGGPTFGALAVDDEPEVFWDGADAQQRIELRRRAVGWKDEWGSVGLAGGNGSSGRSVVDGILRPLGVAPGRTWFTDCLPYYFVKQGSGSQGDRIAEVYQPFAALHGLPPADIPPRPKPAKLVRRALAEELDDLIRQFTEARAPRVVTLGQEAADVLTGLADTERVVLRADASYGTPRPVTVGGTEVDWLPLTHPGNHTPVWNERHEEWTTDS